MGSSFPVADMRVRFTGATDVGRQRQHNEDGLYLPVSERICLVADGMGGHASGEVASKIAVDTISEYFLATEEEVQSTWPFVADFGDRKQHLRMTAAVQLANKRIVEHALSDPRTKGMGTTIVAAYFGDNGVCLGHVGDSRIYRLRDGRLRQITRDHSLANDYVDLGRISAQEAESFPDKNVLVRALGMRKLVPVDVHRAKLRLGDSYMMCTDGLCGMISDAQILGIMQDHQDIDVATEKLIAAANDAGGTDNITAAIARLEQA